MKYRRMDDGTIRVTNVSDSSKAYHLGVRSGWVICGATHLVYHDTDGHVNLLDAERLVASDLASLDMELIADFFDRRPVEF